MAGTGKFTIARTVAREYHDQNRLGANFFSRSGKMSVMPASSLQHCRTASKHTEAS
jgi:hypothetical protein